MPALLLGTYDPQEQVLTFNGVQITGFAEGTFIKVSRNEPTFSYKPSNSGGGARCRNPNKSGRFEFTLHQGSPSNGVLSAFAQLDEALGTGVGEVQVKDLGTTTAKCKAQNGWVVQPPDWTRAKETEDIAWIIETDEVDIAHDGITPT